MSEPQLRCLLCDLVLADATTAGQPTERCKQCGRDILAGQAAPTGGQPIDLQVIGRKESPREDIPEVPVASKVTPPPLPPPPPPLKPMLEDDLPVAAVVSKPTAPESVPTVKPRPRADAPQKYVPKVPPPPRKQPLPDPAPVRSERPRPKIALALGALGCVTVLVMACIVVIAYALLVGLKRAGKAEALPVPEWRTHTDLGKA